MTHPHALMIALGGSMLFGCAEEDPTNRDGDDTAAAEDSAVEDTDTDEPIVDPEPEAFYDIEEMGITNLGASPSRVGAVITVEWDQAFEDPDQQAEAFIEYTLDGVEWLQTPSQTISAGPQEIFVVGLPFDSSIDYRPILEYNDQQRIPTETYRVATGTYPTNLPSPTLHTRFDDTKFAAGDDYLLGSISEEANGWSTDGNFWTFIVDRQGQVVWAQKTPNSHRTMQPQRTVDGEGILIDENSFWMPNTDDNRQGLEGQIHRVTLDGNIAETYKTPGLHHPFTQLPDGSIVWGASPLGPSNEQIEVLPPKKTDGFRESVEIWDCREDFYQIYDLNDKLNCPSNTLVYHEPTDVFLISFYSTSTIVEVSRTTGQTLRHWSTDPETMNSPYAFSPANANFEWQHGMTFTDQGTLLLSARYTVDPNDNASEKFTVAREYRIDDDNQVLEEIWNFGFEAPTVYGQTAGEAERLDNGNTLHNYGSASRVYEVTQAGEVVWDLRWPQNHLLGKTTFLSRDELYQLAP
ncbi:MAG: aryl-sulfate sulfotransferase [Myxococcota bacterium]